MTELSDCLWTEKYRPSTFDELICEHKESIKKYLKNPKELPSFIFYSQSPGTGKTSCAKLIAKELNADFLMINASDERGIDTIRDKIRRFAASISSVDGVKRCVFLDEADGLTKQAQESMKSLMEQYSANCFFVFSCNDISKIIEPIRKGRCVTFEFKTPKEDDIIKRLAYICKQEDLSLDLGEVLKLIRSEYPDIRSMIQTLQLAKIENKTVLVDYEGYNEFMRLMKSKNIKGIYETVYSGNFNMTGFVRYYFRKLFELSDQVDIDRLARVSGLLADIEKSWAIGVTHEIVFLANILEIVRGSK